MSLFCPELATNQVVSLPELLASRESRQLRQQRWLAKHSVTLISLTIVSPGAIKDTPLTRSIFNLAWQGITTLCSKQRWISLEREVFMLATGLEGFIAIDQPAELVKRAAMTLEQEHPIARLWDIDIINTQGHILSRRDMKLAPRSCLICQQDARICARNRIHSIAELLTVMEALLDDTSL